MIHACLSCRCSDVTNIPRTTWYSHMLLVSAFTKQFDHAGIHLTTGTRTSILVKQTDFFWIGITVPKFKLNSQDISLSNTPENTD